MTELLIHGVAVRVHATVTRITRPGYGSLYWLPDRRDPLRGRQPLGPDEGWPGEAIKGGAPDGYDLEPEAGKGAVRLRRLARWDVDGVFPRGIVIGSCIRYEGTYSSGYGPDDAYEQGAFTDRRAVRLVEVALEVGRNQPAELVLVWHEDLKCEAGAKR